MQPDFKILAIPHPFPGSALLRWWVCDRKMIIKTTFPQPVTWHITNSVQSGTPNLSIFHYFMSENDAEAKCRQHKLRLGRGTEDRRVTSSCNLRIESNEEKVAQLHGFVISLRQSANWDNQPTSVKPHSCPWQVWNHIFVTDFDPYLHVFKKNMFTRRVSDLLYKPVETNAAALKLLQ